MTGKDFFEDMEPSDDELPSGDPKGKGPMWYLNKFHDLVDTILIHPGLPWFFIGLGLEALTTVLYFHFIGVAYPTIDALTGLVIGIWVLWWQRKRIEEV